MLPSGEDDLSLHDLLSQCASNLTEKAAQGELPTAYGRDLEIDQIMTSLASPLKGRIVVTGGPRVGKTAVIQGIAARIQAGNCPEALKGSEVWSLSARSILRAFGVRDWHDKLGRLMEKWADRPDVILCVDALPTTLMAGATAEDPYDMAQFLLGQLQSSSNRILAEGRTQAVQSFLEAYAEYKHVLMEVRISEPPLEAARAIVQQAVSDLEASQGVEVAPEAVEVALDLTRRFALNERLPGKAIDLIAEGIALRSERGTADLRVGKHDIVERFGEQTGLPRMLLTDEEPYDEREVRRYFSDRVLGQDQAVDVVVQALSLLRARLNNPNRPMGVFLFIGPTGVGKTELARALAQFLFGSEEHLVRFNMADYIAEWHTDTLFGSPHGFSTESKRGLFTLRIQDHAFAVILLDEFEKAHPEVFQRFLQVFDEGILINGASEIINLRNSIVILTSNFGARILAAGRLSFGPTATVEEQEVRIREEMVQFFTPEFINRIDAVTFFKPLTKTVLREIAYRRVQEVLKREGLMRRNMEVEVDEGVIDWVVEHGYSERYGARYLARQIEKTITYPLAQQLIRNDPPAGSLLRLFVHNDRVASALVLPAKTHPAEEVTPAAARRDERKLPKRLGVVDIRAGLPHLRDRVEALEAAQHVVAARSRLADMIQSMSSPSFWDDPGAIQPHLTLLGRLSAQVEQIDGLRRNLDELEEYLAQATRNGGNALGEAAIRYRYLTRELPRVELTLMFEDPRDALGVYLRIEARGRRLAAQKWVAELATMYLKWAARREFPATVISEEPGKAGSLHAVWLGIDGYGAYGLLRGEAGPHRLVQPDPLEKDKRQVVQALVTAWPDLPQDELPPLDRSTVVIKMHRASQTGVLLKRPSTRVEVSLGGTQAAICLTGELPAADLAEEGLTVLRIGQVMANQAVAHGADPIWGDVVRSYVRFRQRYVHDTATGLKTGKLAATLNGALDPFLEARLHRPSSGGSVLTRLPHGDEEG